MCTESEAVIRAKELLRELDNTCIANAQAAKINMQAARHHLEYSRSTEITSFIDDLDAAVIAISDDIGEEVFLRNQIRRYIDLM